MYTIGKDTDKRGKHMKDKKKEITILKQKRKELGLTQQDVAKILNVSRQSVNYWENNMMSPVGSDMWRIILLYNMNEKEVYEWIRQISKNDWHLIGLKV